MVKDQNLSKDRMSLISELNKSRLDYYRALDFEIKWKIQTNPFKSITKTAHEKKLLLKRRLKIEDIKFVILHGTTKPTKLVKQLIRRANSLY